MNVVLFVSGLLFGISVTALLMGGRPDWSFLMLGAMVGVAFHIGKELS